MKLHLILTNKWFDLIFSGQKTVEYREYKKWHNKLENVDTLIFHRGYTKNIMERKIKSIDIIETANDLYVNGGIKTLKINLI